MVIATPNPDSCKRLRRLRLLFGLALVAYPTSMRVIFTKRDTTVSAFLHPLKAIDGNLEVESLLCLNKISVIEKHGRIVASVVRVRIALEAPTLAVGYRGLV